MERLELALPLTGIAAAFACGALCGRSVGRADGGAVEKEKQLTGEDEVGSGPSEATRDRWEVEQQKLREKLRTNDDPQVAALLDSLASADGRKWLVAGLDISFVKENDEDAFASVVVVELPTLRRVCAVHEQITLDEPYIAGFLAFREAPHYERLLQRLAREHPEAVPVVVLVDGNGVLHPRGFGCASHIGVLAGVPTVGIAKDLQLVDGLDKNEIRELCAASQLQHGQSVPLVGKSGKTWGAALRTSQPPKGTKGNAVHTFKPVYVSIGHGISLTSAVALVTACCKHRIPEPVRLADLEGRDAVRNLPAPEVEVNTEAEQRPEVTACAPCSTPALSRTGLVYDPAMMDHRDPSDSESSTHPECPERISTIYQRLDETGLAQRCVRVPSRRATKAELETVHSSAHVDTVMQIGGMDASSRQSLARGWNSVFLSEGSTEASLLAAGSVTELVMRVVRGELDNGVAVVRPPGHHAECGCAMGFSLFGNVAVAARAARAAGVERVLIVDWDVHHGNGTQRMFENDPSVLYFSLHRHDQGRFYPGSDYGGVESTGVGAGVGYSLNVPWDVKSARVGPGDAEYAAAFTQVLLPVAQDFNPELVLVSAGFDAAAGDPLGGCEISPAGFGYMTALLLGLARGKLVLALEGGYNLSSISHSMEACTAALLGDPPSAPLGEGVDGSAEPLILGGGENGNALAAECFAQTIREARSVATRYWPTVARLDGVALDVDAIKQRITAIYAVRCPEKLKGVDKLLKKYAGREYELCIKCVQTAL
jgi:acetoin utilization deacetylase AcuC-like enzyme/deoxyinosine 3'endonuclease (endonuclease V)